MSSSDTTSPHVPAIATSPTGKLLTLQVIIDNLEYGNQSIQKVTWLVAHKNNWAYLHTDSCNRAKIDPQYLIIIFVWITNML